MKKFLLIIFILIIIAGLLAGGLILFRQSKKAGELFPEELIEVEKAEPPLPLDQFINDQDRDGIPDEEEEKLGLSNRDFDTDGDGLSDWAEINVWGTDPLNPDTDNDGYWDGLEVVTGYNPNGSGKLPSTL